MIRKINEIPPKERKENVIRHLTEIVYHNENYYVIEAVVYKNSFKIREHDIHSTICIYETKNNVVGKCVSKEVFPDILTENQIQTGFNNIRNNIILYIHGTDTTATNNSN